ncbi:hypothetical protein GBA65_14840 [Rubrobacter marinus]|uniref:Uncharacterized protein n=1 Tax=Rubrobacter marinus TaxID=2653852 RepID=A0A6G8PZE0_9ACTN|nr:hypothetical protein [Rubrobacter marinus]QIN79583.1 hypothetical protein GBA65_14840 [Rubrobacter marinus]
MLDYFASDQGLRLLTRGVILAVVIGLLVVFGFVLPSAWRSLRATENRRNGRREFALHLGRTAVGFTVVILIFGGVAADLLFVNDRETRAAVARLGIFFAIVLIILGAIDVPFTNRRMTAARARQLEAAADELKETAIDTNETAHRIEGEIKKGRGGEDA